MPSFYRFPECVCTFLGTSQCSSLEHVEQSSYSSQVCKILKADFISFCLLLSLSPRNWSCPLVGPQCKFVKCMNEQMNTRYRGFLQWHHSDQLETHSTELIKASVFLQHSFSDRSSEYQLGEESPATCSDKISFSSLQIHVLKNNHYQK